MNKDQLQGKWHQLKGSVQAKWGKLTNDDLDQINGNLEKLVGAVQERYGYIRDRAEKEVEEFRKEKEREQAAANAHPADVTR